LQKKTFLKFVYPPLYWKSFEKEELKDEGAILIHHALYHLLLLYFNDFNRL